MFWRFIPDMNQYVNGYFETGKSWIFYQQINFKIFQHNVKAGLCLLWLAILCSLLCPETDRNIPIIEQGYVLILSDFKKYIVMFWCFISDINQGVNSTFNTGKS